MKKLLLNPWLSLITLSLMIVIRLIDYPIIESFRLRYFDQLITSKDITRSQQVQLVNIDDAYVKKTGQFPFPRGEYAKLIEELYQRNAGLVVFNVFMPEKDRFNEDDQLANVLRKYPVVLPHVATMDKDVSSTPYRPGVSVIGGETTTTGVQYESIQANTKIINDNATGIGVVNTLPEIDGVVRRIPMVVNSGGQLYPSISLETLRVAAGDPSFQVKVNENAIEAVRIPQFGKVTTDEVGRIWVDWASAPYEHSATNLPKDFNRNIVIVGVTAKGLNNPVATATGSVYPHHLQGAVLDTVTSGTNISRPEWTLFAELAFIIGVTITSLILARFTHGYVFAIVAAIGTYVGGSYVYEHYQILLDAVYPIVVIIIVSFHGYIIKFLVELNAKLQIKKQFGTYLSPALVEKLQKNPELLQLGGESRELSIMFTDVRGFTTISEHYGKDVQGLTKIMNRYMTAMTAKILDNNGTLDKYIGDAQMAFWNAPVPEVNHAKMAVKTALEMMESLDAFNKEVVAEGVPAFGMGLGINTSIVVVGNMGSTQRFDYTCLGDGVNLASRLEGQSKPYGVRIILGTDTAKYVEDEYFVLELDTIAVKGKTEGVTIYTVLSSSNEEYLDSRKAHNEMLSDYRVRDWNHARALLTELAGAFDNQMDYYYNMMSERIDYFELNDPGIQWGGITRMTTK
jgi:adenylate cyclase